MNSRILHASADFADPKRIVPVIDIAAETTVKGYNIKMNLEGQIDHFNMSLSSDPPLKEMDILVSSDGRKDQRRTEGA